MIHCIGNSHTHIFRELGVNIFHIGPVTATGIAQHRHIILNTLEKINKEDDKIIFVFGEIDFRKHLPVEIFKKNKNFEETIQFSADEYLRNILYFKNLGYNISIWASAPTLPKLETEDSAYYGTMLQRNSITNYFNKYLEELCKKNDIIFLSIWHKVVLENGETNMEYLDIYSHFNTKTHPFIIEELKKL